MRIFTGEKVRGFFVAVEPLVIHPDGFHHRQMLGPVDKTENIRPGLPGEHHHIFKMLAGRHDAALAVPVLRIFNKYHVQRHNPSLRCHKFKARKQPFTIQLRRFAGLAGLWIHDFIHRQDRPLHPDLRRPVRADVPDFIDAVRPAVKQIPGHHLLIAPAALHGALHLKRHRSAVQLRQRVRHLHPFQGNTVQVPPAGGPPGLHGEAQGLHGQPVRQLRRRHPRRLKRNNVRQRLVLVERERHPVRRQPPHADLTAVNRVFRPDQQPFRHQAVQEAVNRLYRRNPQPLRNQLRRGTQLFPQPAQGQPCFLRVPRLPLRVADVVSLQCHQYSPAKSSSPGRCRPASGWYSASGSVFASTGKVFSGISRRSTRSGLLNDSRATPSPVITANPSGRCCRVFTSNSGRASFWMKLSPLMCSTFPASRLARRRSTSTRISPVWPAAHCADSWLAAR
ncbi:hypothetical protein UUU_45060 [Klebsiella pneumoniae subsp. pneumoniae DSM 30104 = JCM 1662 = NBRC 14940]|nr:hypothetical protein UUU_45060 [Klebsiella pneumoniae subsp. pneumoniae DSM 30104 = JCM 1662 = NBRC 14940]